MSNKEKEIEQVINMLNSSSESDTDIKIIKEIRLNLIALEKGVNTEYAKKEIKRLANSL